MKLFHNLWLLFRWSSLSDVTIAVCFGIICGIGALLAPLLTMGSVIVIAAFIFGKVASRPMIMCYLVIFFTIFTSAMLRGRVIPQLALNEVILVLTFLLSVLFVITRQNDKPIPTTILVGLIIFVLGTAIIPIISYQLRGVSLGTSALLKFLAPIQYFLIFWVFLVIPRNHTDRVRIIQFMFFCATIGGAIGLLQAANFPPIIEFLKTWYPSSHLEAAAEAGRITSVFGSWNTFGTFMMMNLLVLVSLQNEPFAKIYKTNMLASSVISFLALIGSGSFAGIGSFIVGFIIIKLFDPRGLKDLVPIFIVGVMGMLLLSPLISSRLDYQFNRGDGGLVPSTFVYRLEIWRTIYIPLVAQNPIWGSTPTFENLSFIHAESQYLYYLVRSGIISLVAFLSWVVATMAWLFLIIRGKYSIIQMIALAVFVILLLLLVMGFTNPVFTYSGVIDYLWIYLGVIASSLKNKLHVAY